MPPIAKTYIQVLPDFTEFRRRVAAEQKVMVSRAAAASAAGAAAGGRGSASAGGAATVAAAAAAGGSGIRGWDTPAGGGRFYLGGRAVQRYPRFVIGGPDFGLPDPLISMTRRVSRVRNEANIIQFSRKARMLEQAETVFNLAPYLTSGFKTGTAGLPPSPPTPRLTGAPEIARRRAVERSWLRRGAVLNPAQAALDALQMGRGVKYKAGDIPPALAARLIDPITGKAYVPKKLALESADVTGLLGRIRNRGTKLLEWFEKTTASLGLIIRKVPVVGKPIYYAARLLKVLGPAGTVAAALGFGMFGAGTYANQQFQLASAYQQRQVAPLMGRAGPVATGPTGIQRLLAEAEGRRAMFTSGPGTRNYQQQMKVLTDRLERMTDPTRVAGSMAIVDVGAQANTFWAFLKDQVRMTLGGMVMGDQFTIRQLDKRGRLGITPDQLKKAVEADVSAIAPKYQAQAAAMRAGIIDDPATLHMKEIIRTNPKFAALREDADGKPGSVPASGLGSYGVRGGMVTGFVPSAQSKLDNIERLQLELVAMVRARMNPPVGGRVLTPAQEEARELEWAANRGGRNLIPQAGLLAIYGGLY